jgi:hypothetical protein
MQCIAPAKPSRLRSAPTPIDAPVGADRVRDLFGDNTIALAERSYNNKKNLQERILIRDPVRCRLFAHEMRSYIDQGPLQERLAGAIHDNILSAACIHRAIRNNMRHVETSPGARRQPVSLL